MTRVSLKEAYDNKDVVAQIYAIRDTAESAEDSAEQAVTTANTASDHVDALVPQVEGAVENANSASASAQASARTVAGYENRLATVETGLNNVTLRVTTAEGQIVTIQGRVTALETADGQNVKLTGPNAIGNFAVLLTGNQTKSGVLTLTSTDPIKVKQNNVSWAGPTPTFYLDRLVYACDKDEKKTVEVYATHDAGGQNNAQFVCTGYTADENNEYTVSNRALINLQVRSTDGKCRLILQTPAGQTIVIQDWIA